MLFDWDEHSHPVFDGGSNNLYFIDLAVTLLTHQRLCCINTINYWECSGWPNSCTRIPEEGTEEWPQGPVYYKWEWLAGAVYGNIFYIAGSGTFHNKVIISGRQDLESALVAWDTTTGSLIGTWRMKGDMFNSAPLVVQGNTGGPTWVSADLTPVPDGDLPASTYSYLSVTPSGTILVTDTVGGADWADAKMYQAVINGIYCPGQPSSSAGSPQG